MSPESANSFAESGISAPPRATSRLAGSSLEVAGRNGLSLRALEVASAYEGAQAREELGEGEPAVARARRSTPTGRCAWYCPSAPAASPTPWRD